MLRGAWLFVIAAGLVALCLPVASAAERVTVNESVLDCVPEGCFVVRFVPVPRLKPEQHQSGSTDSESAKIGAENDKRGTDENAPSLIDDPKTKPEQGETGSAKTEEEDRSPVKRRTVWDLLWGLFSTAEAITAWGTIAAAGIAGIAVSYLKGTLDASRKAEANTSQLLLAETRPWIRLSLEDIFVENAGTRHEKSVSVAYRVINHGKGPALNVVTEMMVIDTALAHIFFNDNEAVRGFYEACKETYPLRSSANMNSLLPIPELGNTGIVDETIRLPILDEFGLGLGDRKFCLAVCSTYKDAIGNAHQTGVFAHAIDAGPYLERADGTTWTRSFNERDQPVHMRIEVKAEGGYHT